MEALDLLEKRYALKVNSKLIASINAPVTRWVVVKMTNAVIGSPSIDVNFPK
jgi:hypothetical protein